MIDRDVLTVALLMRYHILSQTAAFSVTE